VGESATIGAGSSFAGNILALTSITLATGANLSGRALARNGAVTLDTNTISKAPCSQAPTPTPVPAPTHVISATSIPTAALVPTVVRAPVVIPVAGADRGDARVPVAPHAMSVSLGLLSLGFLGLGLGLILFAVRRK
jgi:Ice-binding-like